MSSSSELPTDGRPNPNDPYTILGVSNQASMNEIRAAYKKAALLYHPDRQSKQQSYFGNKSSNSDIERIEAHEKFTKINSAYELLSDPIQRYRYDQQQKQRQQQQQYNSDPSILRRYTTKSRNTMNVDDYDDIMNSDHINNPFHLFDKVFREEFGSDIFGPRGYPRSDRQDPNSMDDNDMFPPSSITDLFGRRRDSRNSNANAAPTFPFFGGSHPFGDIFRDHEEMMKRMTEEIEKQQQGGPQDKSLHRRNSKQQPQRSYYSTSSSSSSSTVRNANGEMVTTIEKVISQNGLPPQKVKETIIRNKDGTIKERHVTGDENLLQQQEQNINRQQLPPFTTTRRTLPSQQQQQKQIESSNNNNNNNNSSWFPSWLIGGSSTKSSNTKKNDKDNNSGNGSAE